MKLLILCDRNSVDLRAETQNSGEKAGYEVETVILNGDEIKPCKACFSCWIRTPGVCCITDDGINEIAKAFMNADVVLLLSQVVYGGYSPDIKAFLDRSIQNMSPFFTVVDDEMHHKKRYDQYPTWINVGYGDLTDDEQSTFEQLTERNALNFFPQSHHCIVIRRPSDINGKMEELQELLGGQ